MQLRHIEKYIENKTAQIEDAYLSIDVQEKNGTEPVSAALRKEIEMSTVYLALKKYLENNTVNEIWLTDDFIDFEEEPLGMFLELLSGKDILTHICVEAIKVPLVKNKLSEALDYELDKGYLLLRWQYEDESYVVELLRKCYKSKYILRIYENGFGIIVHETISDFQSIYFNVEEEFWNDIVEAAEKKVIDIIEHPEEVHEDDRCYLPVHLKYGLSWKVPDAEDLLGKYEVYEDCDYSTTENDIPLALKLLMIPEVNKVWPEPEKSIRLFEKRRKGKKKRSYSEK